jgi:hypothetical protein
MQPQRTIVRAISSTSTSNRGGYASIRERIVDESGKLSFPEQQILNIDEGFHGPVF